MTVFVALGDSTTSALTSDVVAKQLPAARVHRLDERAHHEVAAALLWIDRA